MGKKVNFYVPAHFEKSKDRTNQMRIMGYASTPDVDREQEQVIQEGLDISNFVDYGFFNLDHESGTIVGYPDKEKTKVTKDGLYVEGYILDTPVGRKLWETAVALQKSEAPRRLGFSIEGDVVKRGEDGKILKATIYNVAITATPVNPHSTWEAVVKSMTSDNATAIIRESFENGIRCFKNALDGEDEAITILQNFKTKLNFSSDKDDIKLYLKLFRGLSGKKLENKTNSIMKELEGDINV